MTSSLVIGGASSGVVKYPQNGAAASYLEEPPGVASTRREDKLGVPVRASQVLGDPARHLRPRAEAQFGQDVLEVALNRSFRQEQTLGDSAARPPGGNKPCDLQLALAQAAGAACRVAAARPTAGLAC